MVKVDVFRHFIRKRIQNDVKNDVMHDAKWSYVSFKFKWRSCIRPCW